MENDDDVARFSCSFLYLWEGKQISFFYFRVSDALMFVTFSPLLKALDKCSLRDIRKSYSSSTPLLGESGRGYKLSKPLLFII